MKDRERQSERGGGAEREGDTESKTGSRLWPVSTELDVGLKLTNHEIMTWAEVGHSTDWATQVPLLIFVLTANFVDKVEWSLQKKKKIRQFYSPAENLQAFPIVFRIKNKIITISFRALSGLAFVYFSNAICCYSFTHKVSFTVDFWQFVCKPSCFLFEAILFTWGHSAPTILHSYFLFILHVSA